MIDGGVRSEPRNQSRICWCCCGFQVGTQYGVGDHLKPRKSGPVFGVGAGLFFLAYCALEIPSILILERVGARRWIARILVGWGVVSMGTMCITDTWTFMVSRLLLGCAEAGFLPAVILYLTYWIPAVDRARTGALFMMAGPVAVIVGAPLSDALLKLEGRARAAPVAATERTYEHFAAFVSELIGSAPR